MSSALPITTPSKARVNFSEAARRAMLDFEVVIGEERTLADRSHVIGLFLKERARLPTLSKKSFEKSASKAALQPSSSVSAPRRRPASSVRGPWKGVSGFEIFNPKCSLEENQNDRAHCVVLAWLRSEAVMLTTKAIWGNA